MEGRNLAPNQQESELPLGFSHPHSARVSDRKCYSFFALRSILKASRWIVLCGWQRRGSLQTCGAPPGPGLWGTWVPQRAARPSQVVMRAEDGAALVGSSSLSGSSPHLLQGPQDGQCKGPLHVPRALSCREPSRPLPKLLLKDIWTQASWRTPGSLKDRASISYSPSCPSFLPSCKPDSGDDSMQLSQR